MELVYFYFNSLKANKEAISLKQERIRKDFWVFLCAGAAVTVSQSMLTQQGVPVVGLSNGKSYCFSLSLETW